MVDYDPFSDEVMSDPHPVYRRLRREAPVYHVEEYDSFALSRFDDILATSADTLNFTVSRGTSAPQLMTKVLPAFPNLNHMDPPAHTRLRKQVWAYFSPRGVKQYESRLRKLMRERLAELLPTGGCDVMNDLAFPVSARAACVAVGFPESDAPLLVGLVQRFFRREEGVVGMPPDGMAAYAQMEQYLQDLARERIAAGVTADNAVNTILSVDRIGDERPSIETRASHLMLLLTGSTETFPKTFASAVYRMAEHPDQRREIVADPSLIPDAYHEVLRYDMPTQFLCRTALRDVEVRGVRIREGCPVMMLYPSGNRDEAEFDEPDRFDLHRRAPRILSFGWGVHRCMGVHFAKLEGRVLLEEFFSALPEYEIVESEIHRERTEFVQGFRSLPIRFDARLDSRFEATTLE